MTCPICGTPLRPRQKTCSGACRAEKSRRTREDALAVAVASEVLASLGAAPAPRGS